MTLQDRLDKHRAEFQKNAPAEALEIMQQANADLEASGILDGTAKTGVKAPSFILPDEKGQMNDTGHFLQKGPLVISFYRGVW